VVHRVVTRQKPAIASIMLAQPQLHFVSRATCHTPIPASLHPFRIIRMNERTGAKKPSGCLPPLFKTKADVIERNAVGVKTFATRSEHSNKLRNEVDDLTELHFTSAPFLLCSFALSNVDHSAH